MRITKRNIEDVLRRRLDPPPPPPKSRAQRQAETARQPRCALCNNVVGRNQHGVWNKYCGHHIDHEQQAHALERARDSILDRLLAIEERLDRLERGEWP